MKRVAGFYRLTGPFLLLPLGFFGFGGVPVRTLVQDLLAMICLFAL